MAELKTFENVYSMKKEHEAGLAKKHNTNKAELGKINQSKQLIYKMMCEKIVSLLFDNQSFFIKVISTILKMQSVNSNFMKLTIDILKYYQGYFDLDDPIKELVYPGSDVCVYRKLNVQPNLMDKFLTYIKNDKYLFFPGMFCATKDRKYMLELTGNVLINVKVEPDYVYQCYTLFSEKKFPKSPAFMKYGPNSEFAYKQELLFPACYPFKIMGVKKTNDIYEVFCCCPNVFHYNDTSITMLNKDHESFETKSKNKKDNGEFMDNSESLDSKTKICPLKYKKEC